MAALSIPSFHCSLVSSSIRLHPSPPSCSSSCRPSTVPVFHRRFSLPRPPTPSLHFSASVVVADDDAGQERFDDGEALDEDGEVFRNTRRLVECAMFAAVSSLAYFLSNSLAIENYLGCFFPLPIVITSVRWGVPSGRKTLMTTSLLLFVLSGPVKASTYLLMHGVVGLVMGTLWSLKANWASSILLCSITRAIGACGYVLMSSFLIRENILQLITINIHASLTYILTSARINSIPSMNTIYMIFGTLLLLNCIVLISLLHVLYAVFLTRLDLRGSLRLPRWLEKAI